MKSFFLGIILGTIALFIFNQSDFKEIIGEVVEDVSIVVDSASIQLNNEPVYEEMEEVSNSAYKFTTDLNNYKYDEEKFIKKNFIKNEELYLKDNEPITTKDFEQFLVTMSFFLSVDEEIKYNLKYDDFEKSEILSNFEKAHENVYEQYPELFTQFNGFNINYRSDNEEKLEKE